MLNLALLFLIPYLGFVYFGDHFNPWRKPGGHVAKRKWIKGRRAGLILFALVMGYTGVSLIL